MLGLLVLGGVGIVMTGLFPWSLVDGRLFEPPAHLAGAALAFFATGLGMVVFSRAMRHDPAWRTYSTYTLCSGLGMLVLSFAVGSLAKPEGAPLHAWFGLLQRVLCAVWFAWSILTAVRLRRVPLATGAARSNLRPVRR